MNYANILTGQIVNALPTVITTTTGTTTNPNRDQLLAVGWRQVTQVNPPTAGFRATAYTPEEINATTCRLLVASEVNLADEAAALVVEQKAAARALLDSTDGLGRLFLTLAEQLVILINTERAQHGRSQITSAQIVATLKAALQ